jgi:hypothetical protein
LVFRARFFFAIAILSTRLGYRLPAFFARAFARAFSSLVRCVAGPFGRLRFHGGAFLVAIVAPLREHSVPDPNFEFTSTAHILAFRDPRIMSIDPAIAFATHSQ